MQATMLALTQQNVTRGRGGGGRGGGMWRSGNSGLYSEGGIVSGFTGSNAARCCDDTKTPIHPDWSQGYEIRVRFMVERSTGHQQTLFGDTNSNIFWYAPSLDFDDYPGTVAPTVWGGHSNTGTSWEYELRVGNGLLDFGVWYDAWTRWENGLWTIGVEDPDGTFTDTSSMDNVPAHYVTPVCDFGFGGIAGSSYHAAQYAHIDMSHSFIKIGGVPVWGAYR